MHKLTNWEATRSGAGMTVAMTDCDGKIRKVHVKRIVAGPGTNITAIGGDGSAFALSLSAPDPGDTSAEVASIAGELLNLSADDLDNVSHDDPANRDQLLSKIHAVAASAMGQRA